jgi:glutaredoxin-like protein
MNARSRTQAIAAGERVPDVSLRLLREGEWRELGTSEIFAGRTVVVFGVPGAFTPTCSSQHVPRFNELASTLRALGVDEIICVAVNDPFVMAAWARAEKADRITFAADGNGEFTAAIGMLVDRQDLCFGQRSIRYSMLVRDLIVDAAFVEPDEPGDPYTVSDADTMLLYIDPDAPIPDQVVLFAREGCPHCAHARELLERAGFPFVELLLEDDVRGTIVGAVAGARTVPQVFFNGTLIGGTDELEHMLDGPSGPPEGRPT